MAKDFFRKRPPSKRKANLLALSRTSKVKLIINRDRSIDMQARVVPKGIAYQNQFKKIMKDQEKQDKEDREDESK